MFFLETFFFFLASLMQNISFPFPALEAARIPWLLAPFLHLQRQQHFISLAIISSNISLWLSDLFSASHFLFKDSYNYIGLIWIRQKSLLLKGQLIRNLNNFCSCCCSTSHCVQLFVILWTAASQTPLSFTISWILHKFMSIESVMLSNHLIPCHPFLLLPLIFPTQRTIPMSWLFTSGDQSIGTSALASVLPMNIMLLYTQTTVKYKCNFYMHLETKKKKKMFLSLL